MKRQRLVTLSVVFLALAAGRANAGYAFTSTNGGVNYGPQQSLGFDFTANSAITVTSLGLYDASAGAVSVGQNVYLYDVSTSSVVASVAATSTGTVGTFSYYSLATPVTLNTTDVYSEFSVFGTSSGQYGDGMLTFSTDITNVLIGGVNTGFTQGSAVTPPSNGFSNILAVDFQYTLTAVPEPASVAMMGLGLAGVFAWRRKQARR